MNFLKNKNNQKHLYIFQQSYGAVAIFAASTAVSTGEFTDVFDSFVSLSLTFIVHS